MIISPDGLESDILVGTALIQMFAKSGSIEEARQAFDNLSNRNVADLDCDGWGIRTEW